MSEVVKEISLKDISRVGMRHWPFILLCACCTLIAGCGYAVFAPPYYTSSIVVQLKAGSSLGDSLGALAGRLGSLSSLAGINLGASANSQADNYMGVLQSRELALDFMHTVHAMPVLFPDSWDPVRQQWRAATPGTLAKIQIGLSGILARLSGDQGWRGWSDHPGDWQAYERFKRVLRIDRDRTSGMVTVSFRLRNPEMAADWANKYVALANEQIRGRVIAESNQELKYLNQQVQQTDVAELKTAIYTLVQQRLEEIVSAKSKPDYAFEIVDTAVVPATRSSPKRALIIVVAALLGGVAGFMLILIKEFGDSETATRPHG